VANDVSLNPSTNRICVSGGSDSDCHIGFVINGNTYTKIHTIQVGNDPSGVNE
jgi:DNA-binding beta-propeller fold protein YncE